MGFTCCIKSGILRITYNKQYLKVADAVWFYVTGYVPMRPVNGIMAVHIELR